MMKKRSKQTTKVTAKMGFEEEKEAIEKESYE